MSQVRKEKRKSILWNYYKPIGETYYAKCSFCPVRISYKSTSSNLKSHLQKKHPTMYLKIFKQIKSEAIMKTKNIYDSDPLFFTEPVSPEPEPIKSNKDNAQARRSSLLGLSDTNITDLPGASSSMATDTISDPLLVKFESEDIVTARPRRSSLLGSSNKKLRKPLASRCHKEHEALDTPEVVQAEPKIRKVYQPRFALSWDSYQNRLCSNLNTLLKNEDFVDLTLAAGGRLVKVHQLIMSIASPYLKEIIHSSPARHPIIFLTNVSYPTLRHLLQYVYTGQVDITEEELEPFFAAAKALQIQGIDTEIDTSILKSQAGEQIGNAARLPPDPNETVAEKDISDCDDFEGSQNLILPRSTTKRTSNSPETEKILSERSPTSCPLQTLVEELEPEDVGLTIEEDMVIETSEDLSGGVDPIEFYEVSRTDDPDPVKSPLSKNVDSVTVQTMLLNRYKYSLAKTSEDGVRKWRCIDYSKLGCPARTVTNGNTVVERSRPHNHSFHDKKSSPDHVLK